MAIPQTTIEAAMKILSNWNPLRERAASVKDLDGYRTEAIDILMQSTIDGNKRNAPRIVQTVISQAFEVDVPLADCRAPAGGMWRVHLRSVAGGA
jgi:hypothetical protein